MKSYKTLYIVIILLFSVFVFSKVYWILLEDNNSNTFGQITKCYWGGRGTPKYIVECTFSVGSKKYNSSVQLSCQTINRDSINKIIGKVVPITYNSNYPWINTVLFDINCP